MQAQRIERFTITVTLDGVDADTMMRLVSVFHRRQIEIIQSTYQRVASTGWMVAIVETTQQRLHTTAATVRNIIGVTGYEVALMPAARPAPAVSPGGRSAPRVMPGGVRPTLTR